MTQQPDQLINTTTQKSMTGDLTTREDQILSRLEQIWNNEQEALSDLRHARIERVLQELLERDDCPFADKERFATWLACQFEGDNDIPLVLAALSPGELHPDILEKFMTPADVCEEMENLLKRLRIRRERYFSGTNAQLIEGVL